MTKLTKAQLTEKQDHETKLEETLDALTAAVTEYNDALEALWEEKIGPALEAYNEAVDAANQWRGDIASDMQNYYDERSEKWQEGDKGSAYSDWKDEWSEEFDQVELDKPDAVECDPTDYAVVLRENLREELE